MWLAPSAAIALVASTIVASCAFWRARIPMTRRASARVGLARRRMSLMSCPRPAVPIPSSLTRTVNRSRVGALKMLNRSSRLTGSVVCVTGTVGGCPPTDLSTGLSAVPGSQSM